jgi:hypothetical protein
MHLLEQRGLSSLRAETFAKGPFCPIAVSGSHFNPRNIQDIPPVKIFAFLALEQD